MLLPQGLIRGLATQKLNLDGEEDEEDVADVTRLQPQSNEAVVSRLNNESVDDRKGAGQGNPAGLTRSLSFIKLNFMSSATGDETDVKSNTLWSMMSAVATMFRAKVHDQSNRKRQLKPSIRAVILMTFPFLLWGVVIIIVNGIGNMEVSSISAPVALFNMVRFTNIRRLSN